MQTADVHDRLQNDNTLHKDVGLFRTIHRELQKDQEISEQDILEEIEKHLANGANIDVVDKDDKNNTLLHIAVAKRYEKIVKFLLDKGINTNPSNTDGKTAQDLARDFNYTNIIELLTRYHQKEYQFKKRFHDNDEESIAKKLDLTIKMII